MKNILMVAFSCQPGKGSEPGVGWNWALQIAQQHNVWVLTRTKMKPYITPCIPEYLKDRLHFIYADSSKTLRKLTIYLEYLAWQRSAYQCARKLCNGVTFDYVWHITWGNFFLPTYLYRLKIPMIWGPCGAAEQVPPCFWLQFRFSERIKHMMKYYLGKHILLLPWVKKAAEASCCLIARTSDTKVLFPREIQEKTLVHLESFVTDADFYYPPETACIFQEKANLNLIYTGRIIALKNTEVLVEAMQAILKYDNNVHLHILGDGDEKVFLEKAIAAHGLEQYVTVYGNVPRNELLCALDHCDALLFPSLREGASWSLLEAMYYQKPIVAFDTNGMHDTLSKDGSVLAKLALESVEQTNRNFIDAAVSLVQMTEAERTIMGRNGREHLEQTFYAENIQKWIHHVISD